MKRTLSLLLVLAMMVTMLSLPSFAEEETTTAVENSQIQRAERSSPVHNDEETPEPMEPVFFDPPQIEESEENVDLAALEAFAEEMRAASVQSEAQDGPSMAGGTFDAYIDDKGMLFSFIQYSNEYPNQFYRVKLVNDIEVSTGELPAIIGNLYINGNDKTITAVGLGNDDRTIFNIYGSGKLELVDTVIDGGDAKYTENEYARAVYSEAKEIDGKYYYPSVKLRNCEIRNFYTKSYGGAIALTGSYAELDNCTFTSNRAKADGGAVYLYGCVADIKQCSITENSSYQLGGGICAFNSTIDIIGGEISGNILGTDIGSDKYSYGGGLFTYKCAMVTITDTVIEGNSAEYGGGCGFSKNIKSVITNVSICKNTAWLVGGGIYIYKCTVCLNGATVDSNESFYGGGGVYVDNANAFIDGGSISDNQLRGYYIQNTSEYYGGGAGIYAKHAAPEGNTEPESCIGEIIDAINSYKGGNKPTSASTPTALANALKAMDSKLAEIREYFYGDDDSDNPFGSSSDNLIIDGCEINNNEIDDLAEGYGSGVCTKYYTTVIANSSVCENYNYDYAGGIYAYKSMLLLSDTSVDGNSSYDGGGIYSEETELFISGGSISNNIAQSNNYGYGGGLDIDECEIAIIDKCTIDNNSTIDDGGGMYVDESNLTLTSCTITDNTAEGTPDEGDNYYYSYGGGAYVDESTLTVNGCTISGNSSGYYGGGMYIDDGSAMTLSGGTIEGNIAHNGGGLYIDSSELTMTSGKIINNIAQPGIVDDEPDVENNGWGGGVCLYTDEYDDEYDENHATFNFKGGEISGNTAYYGGGVDTDIYCTFDMSDGSIRDNTADFGGGVAGYYSDFNITGGIITNNFANVSGGGIYADNLRDYEDNSIFTFTMSRKPYIVRNSNPDAIDNVALLDSVITLTGRVYITARVGLNLRLAEMDSPANPYTAVINYLKYKPLLSLFGSTKPFYSDNNNRISRSGSELVIKF